MDFVGWLVLKAFGWVGFMLEYWRFFLGGVIVFVLVFVLPEKMRHSANAISKMLDALYLFLGRAARYFYLTVLVIAVVYGLYQVGNWRKMPKKTASSLVQQQEPTAQDLAKDEFRRRQKREKEPRSKIYSLPERPTPRWLLSPHAPPDRPQGNAIGWHPLLRDLSGSTSFQSTANAVFLFYTRRKWFR